MVNATNYRSFGELKAMPATAVPREQSVRGIRAPASRLVKLHAFLAVFLPALQKGRQQLPGQLDCVLAVEKGLVTQHAVEQQCLVGAGWLAPKRLSVAKLHFDRTDLHHRRREFGVEVD